MRFWPILGGTVALGVGLFGIYDEYFVVVEFIKGVLQPLLAFLGLIAILAGILSKKLKAWQITLGVILLGVGIYGFFDEYYAVLDFFKGSVPLFMLMIGMISVVAGVKQLD